MKKQFEEIYTLLKSIEESINKELALDLSSDEYNNLVFYLSKINIQILEDIKSGVIYE